MSPNLIQGSFRDPGSQVFEYEGRILRAIWPNSADAYEKLRESSLLLQLSAASKIVEWAEIEPEAFEWNRMPSFLLEHPRLPFISYPYEWSFTLLKRAALFHLDLQLEALDAAFTLSDATAYNIQFRGVDPVFIDHLSFRPYHDGEIWQAHRQFCMQFLNPLILWSKRGVSPNHWFRGSLEGISPEDLAPLLSWKDKLSWTILSHVSAQSAFQKRALARPVGKQTKTPKLSRTGFQGMLEGLRSFIAKCEAPIGLTVWADYEHNNSYNSEWKEKKREFVRHAIAYYTPRTLIDLGCNSGEYSELALNSGVEDVFGFDFDFGALEAAVARSTSNELNFLPLWLDAANPSPSQGWDQSERSGFDERAKGDFVLALAFVHHLSIARNVPLGRVVEWITERAPAGVIEFPPKTDPMVQTLLANRDDIFDDYCVESFIAEVETRASIIARMNVSENGRLLVHFHR